MRSTYLSRTEHTNHLQDPVEPTHFWVNPFGVAFSLIRASDLILVNAEGKVIDGGEVRLLNTAAYMIHHAVHTARPDVMCAAHSHSIYGRTFCALGRKLDTITQDSCAFHNDHVVYNSFNGVVLVEEEGKNIAKALGDKKAALLQNHGLLTVGKSIEEAVFWFVSLEKCCHSQLLADAAVAGRGGETVKIDEEDAVYTHKTVGSPIAGMFCVGLVEHERCTDMIKDGSQRSRCSMSFIRSQVEIIWSERGGRLKKLITLTGVRVFYLAFPPYCCTATKSPLIQKTDWRRNTIRHVGRSQVCEFVYQNNHVNWSGLSTSTCKDRNAYLGK
jgi:ribulose-5-phosphate 4-epimerase/fuculose-1-phosphate aldolase